MSYVEKEITLIKREFVDIGKQLHIYLRHFPRYEKHSMVQTLLSTYYDCITLIVEFDLKYYKKTSATSLHISIEVLKTQILIAYELGLFSFHNKLSESEITFVRKEEKGLHRFTVISRMLSKVSEKIDALIPNIKV